MDENLKLWVSRLIKGDASARDLDRIYLSLRARSYGNKAVTEIGDFIAHADQRDRGEVFSVSNDMVTTLVYNMQSIAAREAGIADCADLEKIKNYGKSLLNLHSDAELKRLIGLNRKSAKEVLESAISKLIVGGDGKVYYKEMLTRSEKLTYDFSISKIRVKPAFTSNDLGNQLFSCLLKNSLISKVDLKFLPDVIGFIASHAVEKMHLSKVRVKDNLSVPLFIQTEYNDGKSNVAIYATFPVEGDGIGELRVSVPIFTSNSIVGDVCSGELAETLMRDHTTNRSIELDASGKLLFSDT
ncbi:hypothetical protein [uncultured Sphingomonas sp.]|uniref:hypothetical protein n=1 Tax=uncultured Sphingomonas sp. TaxID=158754 RepID=UPI0025E77B2B|nr:hypothetical protein [uncultured Sphingomonas sp.]